MCKFKNFCAFQILRESNFEGKNLLLCQFSCLSILVFGKFAHFFKDKVFQNGDFDPLKIAKMADFEPMKWAKLISRKIYILADEKTLQFNSILSK